MPLREGAHAIYVARPLWLTLVSALHAEDEGIDALITLVPTPGMLDDGKPSYKFGVGSVLEKLRDVAHVGTAFESRSTEAGKVGGS